MLTRRSSTLPAKNHYLILDFIRRLLDHTRTRLSGQVSDGAVVLRGERNRRPRISSRFTSNWSLFHALGRLQHLRALPSERHPLRFDLLEDLELVKPEQRLWYSGSVETELGGKNVRLHGWEQIGRGILPYTYWLDDWGRLLFAVGGLRTFIWNPNAELPEVKL